MENIYEIMNELLEGGRCYIDIFEVETVESMLKDNKVVYTIEEDPSGLYVVHVGLSEETKMENIVDKLS